MQVLWLCWGLKKFVCECVSMREGGGGLKVQVYLTYHEIFQLQIGSVWVGTEMCVCVCNTIIF